MPPQSWLTTTNHVDRLSPKGREPWGVRHARVSGASRTACGLPAAGWKMFWDLPFDLSRGMRAPTAGPSSGRQAAAHIRVAGESCGGRRALEGPADASAAQGQETRPG